MGIDKTGLAAFLDSILTELSYPGKLAVYFGTVLFLWGIASPEPVKLLSGIALLFYSVSNGYWQDRHRFIQSTEEEPRVVLKRSKVILAILFLMASVVTWWYWLHLPAVVAFRRSVGVPF